MKAESTTSEVEGVRIAYQGEPGAFSEQACRYFVPEAEPVGLPTFAAVFEAVGDHQVEWGTVPVENSYAGSVPTVYDLIQQHTLMIFADLLLPVEQVLMALPGTRLEDIRRVISHPQALAQCDQYLARTTWELVPALDTAGSARQLVQEGRRDVAVIASRQAAKNYGLEILADRIMSQSDNRTRFWLIGPMGRPRLPGRAQTTTIALALNNQPGALYHALEPFAQAHINLYKIESRPDVRPFSSRFILEFEGDLADPATAEAVERCGQACRWLRVLGSYPRIPVPAPNGRSDDRGAG